MHPPTPLAPLKQWQAVLLAVPQTAPGATAAEIEAQTGHKTAPVVLSTAAAEQVPRSAAVVQRTTTRPFRYIRVVDDAAIRAASSLAALQQRLGGPGGGPRRPTSRPRPTTITVTIDRHGQRHALLDLLPGVRTTMIAAGIAVEDWPLLTDAHTAALTAARAALHTLATAPATWTLDDMRRCAQTALAAVDPALPPPSPQP